MTRKLFHAPRTRSLRVLWLLEEMGLDYALEIIPFTKEYLSSPEYRTLNPLGKAPVFQDGSTTMIESVAIMQYLLARNDAKGLAPAVDDERFGAFLQWLHFGEAGMGPYVTMYLGHSVLLPEEQRNPNMLKWAAGEMEKCFAFLSDSLAGKDGLIGDFSAADISVVYMLYLAKLARAGDMFPPAVADYFARVTQRPAWSKASNLGIHQ